MKTSLAVGLPSLLAAGAVFAGAASPAHAAAHRKAQARLTVTLRTPRGVPATVEVKEGRTRRYLAKTPRAASRRFRLTLAPGHVTVISLPDSYDGRYYGLATHAGLTLRPGAKARRTVTVRALPAADQLAAGQVNRTAVSMRFTRPTGAVVALRRTAGTTPATSASAGVAVPTAANGTAIDKGLKPGTGYSYALFTRLSGRWQRTATLQAMTQGASGQASYSIPDTTVKLAPSQVATAAATATGATVTLTPGQAPPNVGSVLIFPVSPRFPQGYLGQVTAVAPDGTVQLAPASLGQAFTTYSFDSSFGNGGSAPGVRTRSPHGEEGSGGSGEGSGGGKTESDKGTCTTADGSGDAAALGISLTPNIGTPSGNVSANFDNGFNFHMDFALPADIKGDVDASAGVTCSYDLIDYVKTLGEIDGVEVLLKVNAGPEATLTGAAKLNGIDASVVAHAIVNASAKISWRWGFIPVPHFSLTHNAYVTKSLTLGGGTELSGELTGSMKGTFTVGPGEDISGNAAGVIAGVSATLEAPTADLTLDGTCVNASVGWKLEGGVDFSAWLNLPVIGKFGVDVPVNLFDLHDETDPAQVGCLTSPPTPPTTGGNGGGSGGGTSASTVTVTSPGDQTSTVGTPITLALHGSDSQGLALNYTATGLPAGLSIAADGAISGTPTQAGSSTVTVTATASDGASASTKFGWTVLAASGGGTQATGPWIPMSVDGSEFNNATSCATQSFCVSVGGEAASVMTAGAWSPATIIDPNGVDLQSVSCPTTSFCVATDGTGNAMTYNGHSWSAPQPTGLDPDSADDSTASEPVGQVSCASASFCVLAGGFDGNSAIWDGTGWTLVPLPSPATQDAYHYDISCPTDGFCMAVGAGDALIYQNGSWTAHTLSDTVSSGAQQTVSCTSSSFCMVGYSDYMFEYSDGQWNQGQEVSMPYTGGLDSVSSVACSSPGFCAAVDQFGDTATFNGQSWTAFAESPQFSGTANPQSLSCPADGTCIAVDYSGAVMTYSTSGGWATGPTISPYGYGQSNSVSCASASYCIDALTDGRVALYDGEWQLPQTLTAASVTAASCPVVGFCMVADDAGETFTLSGTTWSGPDAALPSGNGIALSCTSQTFCAAVQQSTGNAFIYNGSSWQEWRNIVPADNPISGWPQGLSAISCTSASFCMAMTDSGQEATYNGSSWSQPVQADSDGDQGTTTAMSCASASFCVVGDMSGEAAVWNGSAWSSPTTVAPGIGGGTNAGDITALSCTSASFCMGINGAEDRLAFNGNSWSAEPFPSLNTQPMAQFDALDCATQSFCVAGDNSSTGDVLIYDTDS